MFELTDAQIAAMTGPGGTPQAVNPRTHQTYVLVPVDEYRRLTDGGYDDGGWTADELHAQAWAAGRSIGWDATTDYDEPGAGS